MFYGHEAAFLRIADLRSRAAAARVACEADEGRREQQHREEAESRTRGLRDGWSRAA